MSLIQYYENYTGKKAKEIKMSRLEDVFSGEDLKWAKKSEESSEPRHCHFNSAMAMTALHHLKDYEITFCEGIFNGCIAHCWNKVKNLKTGEEYYVDFTLGQRQEQYLLLEEWDRDIIRLFDAKRNAFVPFQEGDYYTENNKRARAILLKHYPAFAVA